MLRQRDALFVLMCALKLTREASCQAVEQKKRLTNMTIEMLKIGTIKQTGMRELEAERDREKKRGAFESTKKDSSRDSLNPSCGRFLEAVAAKLREEGSSE